MEKREEREEEREEAGRGRRESVLRPWRETECCELQSEWGDSKRKSKRKPPIINCACACR